MKETLMVKHSGFTLAEVLITLGIIGVVAAMTIPTLISNYQKTQYVTQLKKSYSQFNQALSQLSLDYGCPGDLACTGLLASGTGDSTFTQALIKKLKVVKDCGTSVNSGCMSANVNSRYDGSGSIINYDDGSYWEVGYKFITADGAAISVAKDADDCSWNNSISGTGNLAKTCGIVIFDVNGPLKGPNFKGRDVFHFWLTNGKGPLLCPIGVADDSNSGWWKGGSCDTNAIGEYCAARVLEQNWQMTY